MFTRRSGAAALLFVQVPQDSKSMKEYIELASRIAAVASTAAIICAGAYELGYLFLIGVHFMGAASITDFFARALELFPILAVMPAMMFLVYIGTARFRRPTSTEEIVIAVIVYSIIPGLLIYTLFFGNLERGVLFIGWFFLTIVLCVTTLSLAAIVTENSRTFALLALGPLLLLVLFVTGLNIAEFEVSSKPNYQVLLGTGSSDSSPHDVRLLRNYQRGLLVRRPGEKIVEFIPWSEIRALKQLAPSR